MSALKAFSGDTYTTRTSSGNAADADADEASMPSRTRSSIALRNAASVLPEPVGAAISVCRPSRIAVQPRNCAAVGEPSVCSNQRATMGWNPGSTEGNLEVGTWKPGVWNDHIAALSQFD